ncbi:AgaE protein [Defluviimonas sp. 20V17]|uniref:AgaE protein n=1 Tax=Allgaiera indica TaxID=765699 RepID=A0AAN4ZYV9_9RHOB|nr:FAD-dependent oxidoreductase [Allgaiera indica]KDB03282.1 AgaE protein [Defluviimonas sp. 20V17]GHE00593.1 AgaE protein [Allgaiera indica]SDW59222.1 Glycine/D-amino acid oxidase [Allgaiera indica]
MTAGHTTAFPFSLPAQPEHAAIPPARADVVVIGGGIIGVMSAWYLRERGLSVVLCEKGRIAAEQSSRNWGWVRQQGRDPAELPIMIESMRLWRGLAAEAGGDLGFRQTGVLYIANRPADLARHEAWAKIGGEHGLDTRMLSAAETRAMLRDPGDWPGGLAGGMWTASDARAEPWIAVPALARALARRGAVVAEACAVRALDIAGGRVAGVVTERGRIACDTVVLAGGAWSALFLGRHGVTIPQLSVLSSAAATVPLPEHFAGAAVDRHLAFRRRADGGYTLAPGDFHEVFLGPDALRHARRFLPHVLADPPGHRILSAAPAGYPDAWRTARHWGTEEVTPFEQVRILDPRPNPRALARAAEAFGRAFPTLGRPRLARAWAGMIDTMPDVVPVVDQMPDLPGLVVATGFSGHGFGIGPGMGRVVADVVAGRAAGHDLSRFRFARFSDGSKPVVGPAL